MIDYCQKRIAPRRLTDIPTKGESIPFSTLASIIVTLEKHGKTSLHLSLSEMLLRLAETNILSHPRLTRLIEVWDSILGMAEERIIVHLREILKEEPDPILVSHVFRCLSGTAAQRGRQTGWHANFFLDVLQRIAREVRDTGGELRCAVCGYHFRAKDMSNDKVRSVLESDLKLAKSLFPGRAADPFKPVERTNQSLTRLSVDHIVPEETFGWSEADNLELLCLFCNVGKLAYRRPLEGVSSFAIGALADTPNTRPYSSFKHQIVVAALRSQGGRCSRCLRSIREVELTVRVVPREEPTALQGFAPWNLESICYNCVANLPDEGLADEASNDVGFGVSPLE